MNQIPQGYQKDQNSGLYYQETAATDAQGAPVRRITWLDPDTGNTTVKDYPVTPPTAQPPQTAPSADPNRGVWASSTPTNQAVSDTPSTSYSTSGNGSYQAQAPQKKKGKGCLIAAIITAVVLFLGGIGIVIALVVGGILANSNSEFDTLLDESLGGNSDVVHDTNANIPTDYLDGTYLEIYPSVYTGDTGEEHIAVVIEGMPENVMQRDFSPEMENAATGDLVYDISAIVGDQMFSISLLGGTETVAEGGYTLGAGLWEYNPDTGVFDFVVDLFTVIEEDYISFYIPVSLADDLYNQDSFSLELVDGDYYDVRDLTIGEDVFLYPE